MIYRRKIRYVLLELTSNLDMKIKENEYAFKNSLLSYMGEHNYANANPHIMRQDGDMFVVRVNRGMERELILATCFMKNIGNSRLGIYSLKTSGSIKGLLKDTGVYFKTRNVNRRLVGKKT